MFGLSNKRIDVNLHAIVLSLFLSIVSTNCVLSKNQSKAKLEGQACQSKPAWSDIVKAMTRRLKKSPNDAEAYVKRAKAHSALSQFEEAFQDFAAAIRIKPDYVDAYFLRGNAYVFSNQNKLAMDDYTHVIEIDPLYADAYHNRSLLYNSLAEKELALKDMEKSRELLEKKSTR